MGERLAGTPAYLAPERRAGAAPSDSQDWYSVGVTLYEALTGRLPFDGALEDGNAAPGNPIRLHPRRSSRRFPTISTRSAWDCCAAIPSGGCRGATRSRRWPIAEPAPRRPVGVEPRQASKPIFVGRTRPLAILTASFAAVRGGAAATVCIHGPVGHRQDGAGRAVPRRRCRPATRRWSCAADATSTSRCRTRPSTGSSTV